MDKKIVIANWKSNKNISEVQSFIKKLSENINRIDLDNKEIIIAPSFHLLEACRNSIEKYNLSVALSAQDISQFPNGAYTGAVSAAQIRDICDMTIIGHSERREYFNEDEDILLKKIREANSNGLKIVYCIQEETQKIPKDVEIVAYEPVSAIGTGFPDDPEHVEKVFGKIREGFSGKILYGGSVDVDNIRDYIHIDQCGGLLIGGASLEINSFINLLSQW